MAAFLFSTFVVLMVLGIPMGFVFGLTALFSFLAMGDATVLTILPQKFFSGMDSFSLLALPFFILAGDIMGRIGLTTRLIDFANLFVGRMRGGLAQVNILTSVVFAGISGSAAADTAALGTVFIPSMEKEGYDKEFSTAVTIASSIISPIIPPSMIAVVYGATMGVSIAGLFAAGILPGLMIAAGLMVYTHVISRKRNYPRRVEPLSWRETLRVVKRAFWGLMLPVIILGGILLGFFTPTEAAAVATGLALVLGLFVYRNLSLKELYRIFYGNTVLIGVIGLCISSAEVLAWILASEQIPEKTARFFLSITQNKYVILFFIAAFLLFIGMFMDIIAALIILGPILAPLAISVGVHPLHFGVVMCINLYIGLITPPMGGCLFISMAISNLPMEKIVKALWPMLMIEIGILFLLIYIPEISLSLPKLLGFME